MHFPSIKAIWCFPSYDVSENRLDSIGNYLSYTLVDSVIMNSNPNTNLLYIPLLIFHFIFYQSQYTTCQIIFDFFFFHFIFELFYKEKKKT